MGAMHKPPPAAIINFMVASISRDTKHMGHTAVLRLLALLGQVDQCPTSTRFKRHTNEQMVTAIT